MANPERVRSIWKSDVHVEAFDKALPIDVEQRITTFAALFQRDRNAFHEQVRAAWNARDLKTFVCLGRVLATNDDLNRKNRTRFVRCLLNLDRHSEALVLFEDGEAPESIYAAHDFAAALIAADRLPEALAVLNKSLELDPVNEAARDFRDRIAECAELHDRIDQLRIWPEVVGLIECELALGARQRALASLCSFLETRPKLEPDTLEDLFRLARKLLVYATRRDFEAFIVAIEPVLAGRPEYAEAGAVREALRNPSSAPSDIVAPGGLSQGNLDLRFGLALAYEAAGLRSIAIDRLGGIATENPRDLPARNVMARFVGDQVLETAPLRFARTGERKIFNLLPFNNEALMLRLRLEEMASWVDYFVIVESSKTFTGLGKPLYFEQWKSEFSKFASQIMHVVVDRFPPFISSAWARDFYQRDTAVSAISGLCGEDDLIFLTDADEIVDRRAVDKFDGEFAGLRMDTYRYFLNYRRKGERADQRGTGSIWRAKYLQRYGCSYARFALGQYDRRHFIHDAGWHFTSIFDAAGVASKLKSYAHQEYRHQDEDYFNEVLGDIRGGRMETGWEHCDIDARFPDYIRRNQEALSDLILDYDDADSCSPPSSYNTKSLA